AVVGEHSTAEDRGAAASVTKEEVTVENTDARKPPLEAPAAAPASKVLDVQEWDRVFSELAAKELAVAGKHSIAVDRRATPSVTEEKVEPAADPTSMTGEDVTAFFQRVRLPRDKRRAAEAARLGGEPLE